MFDEQTSYNTTKVGLELLYDVEMFLGLTYIIPTLEFLSKACLSLLRIETFFNVILSLLSKKVRHNYIKCTLLGG